MPSGRLGLTFGQVGVDDKTKEIPVAPVLLAGLLVAGRVFTMDALLTQRAIAQTIRDGGGGSVMVVKANQPQLAADIALTFAAPGPTEPAWDTATTHEVGHGRVEFRRLNATRALVGYLDWPGAQSA